jgi:hypothetical protein
MTMEPHSVSRRSMLQLAAAGPFGLAALAGANATRAADANHAELTSADGFCIHPSQGSAMLGFPPAEADVYSPEATAQRHDMHRWALRNTRELVPTQRISRGVGPIRTLKRNPIPIDEFNQFEIRNVEARV